MLRSPVRCRANEGSAVEATRNQDPVIISESVDAIDGSTKYRNISIPLLTFENDLLGELGMTGLKNGRDYGTDDEQRFLWLVKHFGLAIFTIRMTDSKSV